MGIRVLMRGGIYILFIIAAAAGWLLKRRQRTAANQAKPVISGSPAKQTNALQSPHWQVRLEALRQMAAPAQPEYLPTIISMLNDPDTDVRDAAVEAAAAYGSSAVPELSTFLSEGRLNSREAAARALGMIGDPSAIPALIAALDDESAWVRVQAVNALGKFRTEAAVNALETALGTENDPAARQAIQQAIKVD